MVDIPNDILSEKISLSRYIRADFRRHEFVMNGTLERHAHQQGNV